MFQVFFLILIIFLFSAKSGRAAALPTPPPPRSLYTGRLRPEVQPFSVLYTIFDRKGTPSIDKIVPCSHTVEPRFDEPLYNEGFVMTIFFSPAKITVKCMEQNLDLRNPRYNEHNPQART